MGIEFGWAGLMGNLEPSRFELGFSGLVCAAGFGLGWPNGSMGHVLTDGMALSVLFEV